MTLWKKDFDSATLQLFNGWLEVRVQRTPDGYVASFFPNWGTGIGTFEIGRAPTMNESIRKTNQWLLDYFISELKVLGGEAKKESET